MSGRRANAAARLGAMGRMALLACGHAGEQTGAGGVDLASEAYRKATAHDPCIADKAVWPAYLELEKMA
jgi:hypothetical protein